MGAPASELPNSPLRTMGLSRRALICAFLGLLCIVAAQEAYKYHPACPPYAIYIGFLGASLALSFANMGAAYGTAKAGEGIAAMGVNKPDLVMKSIIPVIMAGVLGIYGLIIAVIISNEIKAGEYSLFTAGAHFAGGLACGLSGLAAGIAIGLVGDSGVRDNAMQPKLYVGLVLVLIFAEALGLYGLIIGLIMASKNENDICTSFS